MVVHHGRRSSLALFGLLPPRKKRNTCYRFVRVHSPPPYSSAPWSFWPVIAAKERDGDVEKVLVEENSHKPRTRPIRVLVDHFHFLFIV